VGKGGNSQSEADRQIANLANCTAAEGVAGSTGRGAAACAPSGLVSYCNKWGGILEVDFDNTRKRLRRMVRGVVTTARLIQDEMTEERHRFRTAFITLTYRPGVTWTRRHIAELLAHYRKWCKRRRCVFRYVWVLESTKAGVPHYHIVAWLPRGVTPPLPDKQGWWPHGCTQAKWARSPVGYIAKYASKGGDGSTKFPRGARLWGSGGVSAAIRERRVWALAPTWVRQFSGNPEEMVRKGSLSKDGHSWWMFLDRGFALRSPWRLNLSMGTVVWEGWTLSDVEFINA
jgi:hypothetical protein